MQHDLVSSVLTESLSPVPIFLRTWDLLFDRAWLFAVRVASFVISQYTRNVVYRIVKLAQEL